MRRSAVVARRSPGQSQRTQRVLLAAGGSRGGGGRGRDAAAAYAEPARDGIEQLLGRQKQVQAYDNGDYTGYPRAELHALRTMGHISPR